MLHLTTALFNNLYISAITGSYDPPFRHLTCWHLLKDHRKFDLLLNSPAPDPPTPRTPSALDEQDEEDADRDKEPNDAEVYRRPIGPKRPKTLEIKTELEPKQMKIAKETLDTHKERKNLLSSQQELLLFNSKVDM